MIATSWLRAFHVYVFVPSLVRFPFRSYVSVWPPNVTWWFAALYVALATAAGCPVRAHVPPTVVRVPAAS